MPTAVEVPADANSIPIPGNYNAGDTLAPESSRNKGLPSFQDVLGTSDCKWNAAEWLLTNESIKHLDICPECGNVGSMDFKVKTTNQMVKDGKSVGFVKLKRLTIAPISRMVPVRRAGWLC